MTRKIIIGLLVLILLAMPVFSATSYWNVNNANLSINDTIFVETTNSRVGIGVSDPSFPLHVKAGGSGYQSARFDGTIGINTDPSTSIASPIIAVTTYGQNTVFASGGTAYPSSLFLRNGLGSVNTAVLEASPGTPQNAKLYSNSGNVLIMPYTNYFVGINDLNPSAILEVNGTGDLVRIGNDTDTILYVNGSSGNVGIGTLTPQQDLEIADSGANSIAGLRLSTYNNQYNYASNIYLVKSNHETKGTLNATTDGDFLGGIYAYGVSSDNSNIAYGGDIIFMQNGPAGVTRTPTDIVFRTSPGGSTSPDVRMVVASNGNVGIGTQTPASTLDVNGSTTLNSVHIGPETSRTIYLNNSMTADDIQAIIDSIGKHIPYGETINVEFADGTYSLDHSLDFTGFYGGGSMYIVGNTSETDAFALHTTQRVSLDFSSSNCNGLNILGNHLNFYVKNLHIKINTNSEDNYGAYLHMTSNVNFWYNYIEATSASYGRMVMAGAGANVYVYRTYFNAGYYGIRSSGTSFIYSRENDDAGTMPVYALYAVEGGTIRKYSTQPTGSTSSETATSGGLIN